MAFFGGSTGVIYRQFSITIVSAMTLSLIIALDFYAVALRHAVLEPYSEEHAKHENRLFTAFNRMFKSNNAKYEKTVAKITRQTTRYLWIFLGIVILMGIIFMRIPTSFLPEEDQGIFFVQVNTPAGATIERTQKALDEIRDYLLTQEKDAVEGVFTVSGFSFGGHGQSSGLAFVRLRDWSKRGGGKNSVQAVAGRAMGRFFQIKRCLSRLSLAPPAVLELGNA